MTKKTYWLFWSLSTALYICFGWQQALKIRNLTFENYHLQQNRVIIHQVDNAGGVMVGKVTGKEIIDGHHTITAGVYGKFLVTEEQYNDIAVGDDIPDYLKGRGN